MLMSVHKMQRIPLALTFEISTWKVDVNLCQIVIGTGDETWISFVITETSE